MVEQRIVPGLSKQEAVKSEPFAGLLSLSMMGLRAEGEQGGVVDLSSPVVTVALSKSGRLGVRLAL